MVSYYWGRLQLSGAVRYQRQNCRKKQDHAKGPHEKRGQGLPSVLTVQFSPGGKLGLILRFDSVFAIAPGAAAI
jgi:hypothetical protein